ncbi:MAG: hypothetical protein RIQ53_2163 [Pseudomonadota bacterium]|jgi:uncharacterized protein YjiK
MKLSHLILSAAAALACGTAQAAALDLSRYQLTGSHTIAALSDLGLEASAVTWAADRNSLFIVGDEGLGVVELSLSGQVLGTMTFDWSGTGSTHHDAEGLTYIGGGQLVVVDERPQIAYQFSFADGASVALASQPWVALTGSTTSVGNVGTEGISHGAASGQYYSVKQDNPAQLRVHTLDFAVGGGTASTSVLANGSAAVFGLNSLSDVQTLSSVVALAGSDAADNLLVLSLDSRHLIELDAATGTVVSSLDLSSLTAQAIEGVTVDAAGTLYLVAEDSGTGNSRLFVLSAVPEPSTWGLMGAGLGLMGLAARRRRG